MKKKPSIDKLIKSIRRIVVGGFIAELSVIVIDAYLCLAWTAESMEMHINMKCREIGLLLVICAGIYLIIDFICTLLPKIFEGFKFKRQDEKEERNNIE